MYWVWKKYNRKTTIAGQRLSSTSTQADRLLNTKGKQETNKIYVYIFLQQSEKFKEKKVHGLQGKTMSYFPFE